MMAFVIKKVVHILWYRPGVKLYVGFPGNIYQYCNYARYPSTACVIIKPYLMALSRRNIVLEGVLVGFREYLYLYCNYAS